jgi:hypothetical protein
MNKISTIDIKNAIISITKIEEEDYICLTDMAKAKVSLRPTPYKKVQIF